MQMFNLGAGLQFRTNEGQIDLLSVVVKHVGVTLHGRYIGGVINALEVCGERVKDCFELRELVEIARNDDSGMRVESKNRANKILL